ncbi:MAG: NAD(P)H-binding protein [Myxococcales bacterium]|nr:NAD(P)H-binding protein [Myxococcales bacterium]
MKALVIGASGAFGGAVAREMIERGIHVTAMVRPGGSAVALDVATVQGDALVAEDVLRAARGQDVIVFGFHVPYTQWDPVAVDAARNVAAAARAVGATVLFPGNVYTLPTSDAPLDERTEPAPRTKLGRIRVEMEAIFERAARDSDAQVIVLRAGDFIAPSDNSWLTHLVKARSVADPAPAGVPHSWAYLPDLARVGVELLLRRDQLAPFEVFHYSGYQLTSQQLHEALAEALGEQRPVKRFPWWGLKLASPFWPMGRALLGMRYLWQEPLLLDERKLQACLGDVPRTPLSQALAAAVS